MTWIAGTGRAGYDHAGEWARTITIALSSPDSIAGDPAVPGTAMPGTFMPCEDIVDVRVEVVAG